MANITPELITLLEAVTEEDVVHANAELPELSPGDINLGECSRDLQILATCGQKLYAKGKTVTAGDEETRIFDNQKDAVHFYFLCTFMNKLITETYGEDAVLHRGWVAGAPRPVRMN